MDIGVTLGVNKNNNLIDQILSPINMRTAWEDVQSAKGSPGTDNISLKRWERNWEENLENLREQVRNNTYRPKRTRYIYVPKKGGGLRELSLLTVSDKVLQRAVLNVIDDLYERRFLNCSHGYRRNRSVATAVKQILKYREQGLLWVLDADILACFDNMDHELILNLVRRVIEDWFVLNLFELWLKAGKKYVKQRKGIPMGGVLSPLWCNIYLHQLDAYLSANRWKMVRYADDFLIMATSLAQIETAKVLVEERLTELNLVLHPKKTVIADFEHGFTFTGVEFQGNRYAYTWEEKRIEVQGNQLKMLWQYPPQFYD